uniref:EGF-like domain-containing protein n=1 Tax=Magallana gigas TaxID=29159 RepID=A0A8W8M8G5_MAGGI
MCCRFLLIAFTLYLILLDEAQYVKHEELFELQSSAGSVHQIDYILLIEKMATQRNFICGILILVTGVLRENILFVRSVCLQDVLSFYTGKMVCSFRRDDFNRIFLDNSKRCQINCSIHSSMPSLSSLNDNEYEIKRITVRFTSTAYEFPLKSSCSSGGIVNVYIELDCEGEYLHDRGIGERCVSASQCGSVNVNSTCNETIGLCQCETGHQCLSGTSTRLPG